MRIALEASPQAVWQQRRVGSSLALLAVGILAAGGVLRLDSPSVVGTVLCGVAYALSFALRADHKATAWSWALCAADLGLMAALMRATGGAASPFQALVYPALFGLSLSHLRHPSSRVVPVLCAVGGLGLLLGALGSPGLALFAGVHAIGMVALGFGLATLVAERGQGRADPLLPELLNRSAGLEALGDWLRSGRPLTLTYLDLGGFKLINDTFGHHVGDEVLRAVARRLRATVRAEDAVVRLGGDEFVVAAEDEGPAERLSNVFERPVSTSVGPLPVRADCGTVRPEPGETLGALLERADRAMYEAKRDRAERDRPAVPPAAPERRAADRS